MKFSLRPAALVCSILLATAALFASDTAMKLTLANGSTATYVLSEKPVVSFDATHVVFTTADAETSYLRSEVADISFVEASAAEKPAIADPESTMSFVNKQIQAPGRQIDVYSVDGRHAASGFESLDLSGLTPGFYIAKAGSQTLKIKL